MCGRFYIRFRRSVAKFDDLFTGLALATLLAFAAISQLITNIEVEGFHSDPFADESTYSTFMKYEMAVSMLAWMTLYLVKASFLALCRSVFGVSTGFRRAWWIVASYTFITAWPIILSLLWQCGSPSNYADGIGCDPPENYDVVTPGLALALHISSDGLILALPLAMIRRLHVSKEQKIGIAAVFALVVVDIVMGIIRNTAWILAHLDKEPSEASIIIATVMAICEPNIAVIVCALPAYGVLLPTVRKRKTQQRKMQQNQARVADRAPRLSTLPLAREEDFMEEYQMETTAGTESEHSTSGHQEHTIV